MDFKNLVLRLHQPSAPIRCSRLWQAAIPTATIVKKAGKLKKLYFKIHWRALEKTWTRGTKISKSEKPMSQVFPSLGSFADVPRGGPSIRYGPIRETLGERDTGRS